mgnify:CR=1 FL=1
MLGALLLGAAVVVGMSRGADEAATAEFEPDKRPPSARSKGESREPDSRSKWERELAGLSLRAVRNQLPPSAPLNHYRPEGREQWERDRHLFRRFGEIAGEAALDEIAGRYGQSRFTMEAMTEAIIGWMAVDRAAALAAFESLMKSSSLAPLEFGMAWKGSLILSGLG